MILISNDFWHSKKIHNFDTHNVLLIIQCIGSISDHIRAAPLVSTSI